MLKPSRLVTFSITLPDGGSFDEHVEALKTTRQIQIDEGNMAAAMAMSVVVALAEMGKIAFETSTAPPPIMRSPIV